MNKTQSDQSFREVILYLLAFLGFIGVLLVAGSAYVYFSVQARLERTYNLNINPVPVSGDPVEIERGRHLVETLAGCEDCHGEDLGGSILFEGPLGDRIVAANLTAGEGGIGGFYKDEDWIRAIRHGVGPDGKPLVYVSSKTLYNLSDRDVGAIIAYLKRLPRVDNPLPPTNVGLISRFFILGDPSLLPAEVIKHNDPRPRAPEPGVTAEYGRYLTIACRECHGINLTGRPSVVGGGKDLTASGDLANWSEEDFMRTLRTGYTPNGDQLDPKLMPWKRIGRLSDDELRAIWLYLKSLPPSQEGD